jgi:hypothetical protein
MITRKKAVEYIRLTRDFNAGSNNTGVVSFTGRTEGDTYVIRSYEAVIATISLLTDEVWITDKKYTQTTGRHISFVRQALSTNLS